jgi:hypothetical protein
MADSLPVVIASNQTAVPISNVNLDAPLSTLATSALQTALNALITTLNGTVSTAALQTALNALVTTLNATVATAANQTAQTALLTTIDADTSNLDVALSTRASAANQTNGPQTTMINNGANTAAVKAAATAPVAADPALVVAISPNTPAIPTTLPSGAQALTSYSNAVAGAYVTAAGITSIGFVTGPVFTGSINGVTRLPNTFYGFEATPGKTLASIPYILIAGDSIIIDELG